MNISNNTQESRSLISESRKHIQAVERLRRELQQEEADLSGTPIQEESTAVEQIEEQEVVEEVSQSKSSKKQKKQKKRAMMVEPTEEVPEESGELSVLEMIEQMNMQSMTGRKAKHMNIDEDMEKSKKGKKGKGRKKLHVCYKQPIPPFTNSTSFTSWQRHPQTFRNDQWS